MSGSRLGRDPSGQGDAARPLSSETGRFWVGLDVGEDRTHLCIVDDEGTVAHEATCPSVARQIAAILKAWKSIGLIAVEAGVGTHLVRGLRGLGYTTELFEARQASKILAIYRNKTDRNDARGLAEIARLARYSISRIHLKSVDFQRLRMWLSLRNQLISQRIAAEGLIRSMFSLHGVKLGHFASAVGIRRKIAAGLAEMEPELVPALSEDVAPLVEVASALRAHISGIDRRLEKFASENPICRSFLEIPGIGPLCAISFYSAIEEPGRFAENSTVGAYLGLTPRVHQSGRQRRRERISKMGNTLTRFHLVMAARVVLKPTPRETALRAWGVAVVARAGHRRARVAVARKLAVMMLAMWKSGTPFRPRPDPTPSADGLHTLRQEDGPGLRAVASRFDEGS